MANGLEGTKAKKWRLTTMKKTIVIAAMAGIMAVAGTGITTNMVMAQENEKSAVIYDSEDTTISGDTQYGYTDTDWEFAFNSSDKKQLHPAPRDKYTNSNIYFNWGSVVHGTITAMEVSPYGYDGSQYVQAGTSTGGRKRYVADTTGKYEIKNFVKRTCNQATIGMRAYKGSGVAKGKWSPDCLGSYMVLQ